MDYDNMPDGSDLWIPHVEEGPQPLYRRLSDAIGSAISSGVLVPGARLPAHRELAYRLSASVGTVSRAYDELARIGLINGTVGRGSFVADLQAKQPAEIDLSRNVPPTGPAILALRETMLSSRNRRDWADGVAYGPPIGTDADRSAGAAWLARTARLEIGAGSQLFCTNGAQTALVAALSALARPGDMILCEAAAYTGLIEIAAQFGFCLCPVTLDEQGMCPDALDRLASETGAKVVVLVPTLQNPTARSMSQIRREAIVTVARARNLFLIEDDVYGCFAKSFAPIPIANIAPERTIYINSLSKSLAPGLRSGLLVAPHGTVSDSVVRALKVFAPCAAGLGQTVATAWIESEKADEILESVVQEATARVRIVAEHIGGDAEIPATGASLHIWWPMAEARVAALAANAKQAGISINAPTAFAAGSGSADIGVRICLGGAPSRDALARACTQLLSMQTRGTVASGVASF